MGSPLVANAPPPPGFYLRDDEEIVLRVGAAPRYAVVAYLEMLGPATGAALVAALLVWWLRRLPDELLWGVAALYLLALGGLAFAARARQRTAEYVVTDTRVYARRGRLLTRVHLAPLDRITDLRFHEGPLERLLGISSLTVMTAGGDVHLAGLAEADAARNAVESARDALVRRLLQLSGARAAPSPRTHAEDAAHPTSAHDAPPPELPAPAPIVGELPAFIQPGDTTIWLARPRPIVALAALRSIAGALPLLLFVYVARGPETAASVGVLFLGIAAMMVAVRFAALRRAVYVATDNRVYARTGLFSTTIARLTYEKITDITYKQDVVGRLLGYGSLTLSTAGGAPPIALQGLSDANAAKEIIERLRARVVREERA